MSINKYNIDEENTKFSFKNYIKALRYLKKYKWQILLLFIIDTIVMGSNLLVIKQMQYILDNALGNTNYSIIYNSLLIMIVLVIVFITSDLIEKRYILKVNQNIVIDIKNDLFTHIQKLPFEYFDTRPHGKILVRLTEYAESVANLITSRLLTIVFLILNMSLTLVFMIITDSKLTLIVLAGVVILTLIMLATANKKRRYKMLINNKYSNYSAYKLETLRGIETTKVFNRENYNINIHNSLLNEFNNSRAKFLWLSNSGWYIGYIISHVTTVAISFVGAMFLYPSISIGTIIAMGEYANNFWEPIRTIFKIIDEFIEGMTNLERIIETIDEPITILDSKDAKEYNIKGNIKFENVDFSYLPDKKVLKNINFEIKENEKIALVGETGSGKSTIANLICRFYEINKGNIKIDGINIKDIKLKSIRSQITIMQQEIFLFSKTIMDNLMYGNDKITKEEVIEICKNINLHNWIMKFPKGYDTILDENGSNLSDGEKQILCYARSIINKPKILILDEATSKIDTRTEKMLQKLTEKITENKTVIIIAHRLSTITKCDRIFFIKNKKVSEIGTHEELMNKKGDYYNLYTSQILERKD